MTTPTENRTQRTEVVREEKKGLSTGVSLVLLTALAGVSYAAGEWDPSETGYPFEGLFNQSVLNQVGQNENANEEAVDVPAGNDITKDLNVAESESDTIGIGLTTAAGEQITVNVSREDYEAVEQYNRGEINASQLREIMGITTEWLAIVVSTADNATAIEAINLAWEAVGEDGWRAGDAEAGTYDIPAHSVVIGSMNAGNDPAFHNLGPNIWYTGEGGRFGTSEGYRAFQLEGALQLPDNRPDSVVDMVEYLLGLENYDLQIAALDLMWTRSDSDEVINRWGSSGPVELLTDSQEATLNASGDAIQPVVQVLPGNTIVWGELAPGEMHFGLERVAENIYITTGNGGQFVTYRGFRAMQFVE